MEDVIAIPREPQEATEDSISETVELKVLSNGSVSKSKKQEKKQGKRSKDDKMAVTQRLKELDETKGKYLRGGESKKREKRFGKVRNKLLRHRLLQEEERLKESALRTARAEILQPAEESYLVAENDLEKTYKFSQNEIKAQADQNTVAKMLDLKFPDFGSYRLDYTRNGRYMALGSSKGHLGVMDSLRNDLKFEINLNETIRDVKFLHNVSMIAVAQKKHLYIYDDTGLEIHRLKNHVAPMKLEFLPYHFLLASVGRGGWLKYQDTSTGELVAEWRTKLGPCDCMAQNPSNAVISLGHANGCLTMWSPSVSKPLVKMLCHKGPIRDIAFLNDGNHMVTAGLDGKVSIWDVRNYKRMHSYYTPRPPMSIGISQTGLLSLGCGYQTLVWKDAIKQKASSPYMRHTIKGQQITHTKFRPYEDILALGHTGGMMTMVVPGSGVSNYDAFEANPFQNAKQMRESEVHSLLEKLQPDMIVLDPASIAKIDQASAEVIEKEKQENQTVEVKQLKNKQRGKSKIGRKLKRMKANVVSEEREKLRKKLEDMQKAKEKLADSESEKGTFAAFFPRKS